jgi:hypothetical protein
LVLILFVFVLEVIVNCENRVVAIAFIIMHYQTHADPIITNRRSFPASFDNAVID